ncbi:hypothetical protein P8452_68518 [Trifolium repens]|nr:hypothetical protein P8452_68518 [Trifolium repens]
MAFFASKLYNVFMFLCLVHLLLLSSCEVEAKLCRSKSRTWSGPCINNSSCSTKCKQSEHASYGSCQRNGFCFCYFNCS